MVKSAPNNKWKCLSMFGSQGKQQQQKVWERKKMSEWKIYSSKMAKFTAISFTEWYIRNAPSEFHNMIILSCSIRLVVKYRHLHMENSTKNRFCSYSYTMWIILYTMNARVILFTDIIRFICIFARNADIPREHFINRILIKYVQRMELINKSFNCL